jgi:putative FmdB family regulatory protein
MDNPRICRTNDKRIEGVPGQMPIYDFECPKCDLIEDVWAKIDETAMKCPRCGRNMSRLISPCAIHGDFSIMGVWEENVAQQPVFFGSKGEKSNYLKDHGLAIKGETPISSQKYQEQEAHRESLRKAQGKSG